MGLPIQEAAKILSTAQNILFITGAGLSADSGLPTFRGIGGLYAEREIEGVPIDIALSGPKFQEDPGLLWRWFARVGGDMGAGKHNRGHEVIALFEQQRERVWVLTQNVDGFHTTAGSEKVIEIHGNMHHLRCTSKACTYTTDVQDYARLNEIPPKCPDCGEIVRPDVVLFGEQLPEDQAITMQNELDQGFDVIVSVGTTALYPYIFEPILEADTLGLLTIEINPSDTQFTEYFTVKVAGKAAESLDAIWEQITSGVV